MRRVSPIALLATLASLSHANSAQGFCQYRDTLYAETTLAEEYRDSHWVVRARVVSERFYGPDACVDCPGRLYELEVIETFKGALPRKFAFYTRQNSGGFYLEQGKAAIGSEWLLFLNPGKWGATDPKAARAATWVNYSCGQSRRWREINREQRATLSRLARR